MWLTIINIPGGEDELDELTVYEREATLPVLQDTTDDDVAESYGAEKWYIYVIDRAGKPRYLHYELDLDGGEQQRLLDEIAELVGEPK